MVDSNAKGARGEYQVRDLIMEWWGVLEPGADFTRTPKSGGWHAAGEYDMAGDLMTKAELFPFCVEVKWREGWSLRFLLTGRPSPVWGWWDQVIGDAMKTEPARVPMLWFRMRAEPWRVIIPEPFSERAHATQPDVGFVRMCGLPFRPVIYTAEHLLRTDPSVFARKIS